MEPVELRQRDDDGRFRAIFASVPECVKRVSADGRLIDINPAGLRMIGAACADEVRGRPLIDLIDPAHHRAFSEAVTHVFEGRTVQLQFEVVSLTGQRLWMDQSAAPLFDRADPGKVIEMVAVTRDITAQRAAERDLLEAKVAEQVARSKSAFLAKVSNELKTPLNQIIGYGELLKEAALDHGRHEELGDIERVLEAGATLLTMINQILAVSLVDARREAAGRASFDLAELVDDCAAAIRTVLHTAATRVIVDFTDTPQHWTGDSQKLDQCLRSALSAAAEFAAHGAVTIKALPVSDRGCAQLQLDIVAQGERVRRDGGETSGAAGASIDEACAHQFGPSALKLARDTARLMGGELKIFADPGGARLRVRVPASPATTEPLIINAD